MTTTPHQTTADEYRAMAQLARETGDLTQAARYERKAKQASVDHDYQQDYPSRAAWMERD